MATTGRPVVNVALDEDSRDELRAFCTKYGVTASGLFEGFVRTLAVQNDRSFLWDLPDWLIQVVAAGRRVDSERRAR